MRSDVGVSHFLVVDSVGVEFFDAHILLGYVLGRRDGFAGLFEACQWVDHAVRAWSAAPEVLHDVLRQGFGGSVDALRAVDASEWCFRRDGAEVVHWEAGLVDVAGLLMVELEGW